MSDPNFPVGLDISPLEIDGGSWEQHEAIKQYGIAGRIWKVHAYYGANVQGGDRIIERVLHPRNEL